MRILYCNKYNHPFSGTEVYLSELMELMRARGHEVALFSMADPRGEPTPYDKYFVPHINFKNDDAAKAGGLWPKMHKAAHAIYSTDARSRIRRMIREFRPDVAHVRNIYHHLSPSILWELKAQRVPVLYHLNDFKLLCPTYNMVAKGKACENCKGGAFWRLGPQCYPGAGARLTLIAEAYAHRWLGTYRKCIDLFLAPSRFVRDKFVEHGWDPDRFGQLAHFQRAHEPRESGPPQHAPLLYFGRLSAEKGVDDLLRAMHQLPDLRLQIAGDGPQRAELQQLTRTLQLTNVDFLGQVGSEQRDSLIAHSRFTVMPSHAYETFGKTILESYAEGRAVVASDTGSRRELIEHGKTGLLYPCGDVNQLATAIRTLTLNPQLTSNMGRAGWELVRTKYTPAEHYEKLLSFYQDLSTKQAPKTMHVAGHAKRGPRPLSPKAHEPIPGASRRALRIAFIGGRGVISKYSGIETYYEEVGSRLAAMGHDVTIYCRNYFTPKLATHNGMNLVRLPTIRSKHLETLVHTVLSTLHALAKGYDIVHYHALGPALFSFLPRLAGSKTLVTVQGLDWQRQKWGWLASQVLRFGEQASVRVPNGTMVVSRALQQRYRQLHGIEAAYVPNGGLLREKTEANKILDWGLKPGNYVLFLGRFSPEKGCHLLVQAFEKMQRRGESRDVHLVMAGASSYCDDYTRQLRAHASDRIHILDSVGGETLNELLTNAMIFALPSELEGLSLALLDAMGAGLCVLTSDVPENREVVEGAGFTFERGSASHLQEQLEYLIAHPKIRNAAGKKARTRVEHQYQWQEIAASIEKAYLAVLNLQPDEVSPKKPAARAVSAGDQKITIEQAG